MSDSKAKIPTGWHVQGAIPDGMPPTKFLFEDLFSVSTPDSELTIDVGWSPAMDPNGSFVCTLVADDWEAPIEEFQTKDPKAVRDWISSTLEAARGIYGDIPEPSTPAVIKPADTDPGLLWIVRQMIRSRYDSQTTKAVASVRVVPDEIPMQQYPAPSDTSAAA